MITAFFSKVKAYLGFETDIRKRRSPEEVEESPQRKRLCIEQPLGLTNHATNMNSSNTGGISRFDGRNRRSVLEDNQSVESCWEKKKPGKENHFHWNMVEKDSEDDDVVELNANDISWKDLKTRYGSLDFKKHCHEAALHLDDENDDVVFLKESSQPEVEEVFPTRLHSSLASGRSKQRKSLATPGLHYITSEPRYNPSQRRFFRDHPSTKVDKPTFGLLKYNVGALGPSNPKKETKPTSRLDSLSVRNRVRTGNLSRAAILKQTLPPPPKYLGAQPKTASKWSLADEQMRKKTSALEMSSRFDERKAYNQMLQHFTRERDPTPKFLSSQLECPAIKMFESQLKRNFTFKKFLNQSPNVVQAKHKIDFVDLSKSDDDIQEVDYLGSDTLTSALQKKRLSISKDAQEAAGTTQKAVKVDVQRTREVTPKVSGETVQNAAAAAPRSACNAVDQLLMGNPITYEDYLVNLLDKYSFEKANITKEVAKEESKKQIWTERRLSLEEIWGEKLKRYKKLTGVIFEEVTIPVEEEKLPELTSVMLDVVHNALRKSRACVLARSGSNTITGADIQTLADSNWLNDEVINNYMDMLIQRGQSKEYPSVYAFNTFFYPRLSSSGYVSVKRWTKKVDLFKQDMVLVPLHLEVHWALAVIDFRQKTICYYDSMNGRKNNILQLMLKYLQEEKLDKKKETFDTLGWETKLVQDIPQQRNGYDCGVFACIFAEHLARGTVKGHSKRGNGLNCNRAYPPFPFSQENMPYFRKRMIYEILTGKLLQ